MNWLVLAKFFLASGTEYMGSRPVQHPDYLYEGRVQSFGYIDKSISVPTGLPQIGDCTVLMNDTDRKWRQLVWDQPIRRKFMELRLMPEGGSESAYDPIGTFEIADAEFPAGQVQITGRDVHFSWLSYKLPNLINRTNFPELAEGLDDAFFPIINGEMISPVDNPQGVVPLPHIGAQTGTGVSFMESGGDSFGVGRDRWALSATPILELVMLYRQKPGEGSFTPVDPEEYTVVQDPPRTIEGIEYNFMFVDFYALQPKGTLIRADALGIKFRGAFFYMPEVSADSASGPLRNPMDFFINLLYVILKSVDQFPPINIDSLERVRNQFQTMIEAGSAGSAGNLPYLCDLAITESFTAGELISRFMTSFEMDCYANRAGELEVNLTRGTDPDRPVFDDTTRNLINSVKQRLANPTFNRIRYRYGFNNATGQWASEGVYDNVGDQALTSGKIGEDRVDLPYVRDKSTADDVMIRRAQFVSLGSYRVQVDLPAPEVRNDIELAKLFGLTSHWGLADGGFVNAEFKTTGITTDLDNLITTLRGVLRVPQAFFISAMPIPLMHVTDMGIGSPTFARTFTKSSFPFVRSEQPTRATFQITITYSNVTGVDREIEVWNSNDEFVMSVPLAAGATDGTYPKLQEAVAPWDPPTDSDVYRFRFPATTIDDDLTIYDFRIEPVTWPRVDKLMIEIPLVSSETRSSTDGDCSTGQLTQTTSTSYLSAGAWWKYNAAEWGNIANLRFYVVLGSAATGPTFGSAAAFWDETANAQVGTEVVYLSADGGDCTHGYKPMDIDPSLLIDGHVYGARIKIYNGTGYNVLLYKTRLQVILDPFEKCMAMIRVGRGNAGVGFGRVRYGDLATWTANGWTGQVYFETSGVGGSRTAVLQDLGTADVGGGGSPVASSQVTLPGSKGVVRSGDIAADLIDGHRYIGVSGGSGGFLEQSLLLLPIVAP